MSRASSASCPIARIARSASARACSTVTRIAYLNGVFFRITAVPAPLALLIIVAIAFVWWSSYAPGQQFLPSFSRLLTGPHDSSGAPSACCSDGRMPRVSFTARDVALRLQLRRGRYQLGYLVVALRRAARRRSILAEWIRRPETKRAGGRCSRSRRMTLLLSVEDGWLKTMWKPIGFIIFPGAFSEEKWRPVLDAMRTVATSLEA